MNGSASVDDEVNTPESGQGPECLQVKGLNFIPKLDEVRIT